MRKKRRTAGNVTFAVFILGPKSIALDIYYNDLARLHVQKKQVNILPKWAFPLFGFGVKIHDYLNIDSPSGSRSPPSHVLNLNQIILLRVGWPQANQKSNIEKFGLKSSPFALFFWRLFGGELLGVGVGLFKVLITHFRFSWLWKYVHSLSEQNH